MTEEQYLEKLEVLLKAAQDEYKQITYDRRAVQHGILKNYMWLSTVLFGTQTAILFTVKAGDAAFLALVPTFWFLFLIALAIVISCATFIFAVDTLRGRGEVRFPYLATFDYYRQYVHREFTGAGRPDNGQPIAFHELYGLMINDLQYAIEGNRKTAGEIGIKLRRMAWLMIGSIAATIAAVFVAAF